jgi:hypothetical protein
MMYMNFRDNNLSGGEGQDAAGEAMDFDTLLRFSMEELMGKSQVHQTAWGFGTEEDWQLDSDQGELVFRFPGRTAIAQVQVIGTYDTENRAWMWSWANPLIAENLKGQAVWLREYGERYGIERLTTPEWLGEESDCWYMVALAAKLADMQGAYRGPAPETQTFMTFTQLSHSPSPEDREQIVGNFKEESAAEFRACIEDLDAQRRACCRYFRRGDMVGLSQSELLDALGLTMPSILDLAGYPPEDTERVMDMVGEISDEEIQSTAAFSPA